MQDRYDFYKLDRTKPVRTEGHIGKVNVVLIFGIIFTLLILSAFIYICATSGLEIQTLTGASFFMILGIVFLVFGIRRQIKYNNLNRAERELLRNCLCTDGIVSECECTERRFSQGDTDRYEYFVTLSYTYYDDKHELQFKTFEKVYNYDPEFYKGQWLMIAFNQTDSAILGKFSFVKEDEERFLKREAERSADDFDDLDGTPVDPERKYQPAELKYTWLRIALTLVGFIVTFAILMSAFAVREYIADNAILDIVVTMVVYIVPITFACVLLVFIIGYLIKIIKYKKILKNSPVYVWGKIFASEKTYRSHARKKVYYCYIDSNGGNHMKTFSGYAFAKKIQGTPSKILIVYDRYGNSLPLDCII